MKKTYITAAAIVSICVIITAVTRTAASNIPEAQPKTEISQNTESEPTNVTQVEESDSYLLTELDGRLVVYAAGIANPIKITDTYLRDLPEYDREKIKSGIKIYGDEALRKALEDYCS